MDLRIMAIWGVLHISQTSRLELRHQMQFNIIARTFVLFDPQMGPKQILPCRLRVDLRVMGKKGYSIFPKALDLEPHHQIECRVISRVGLQRWSRCILKPQPSGLEGIGIYFFLDLDK